MPVHFLELNEDVISCILSFIFDSHTIYTVLRAIPPTNPFFSQALTRLCQLPIHLSFDEQSIAATLDILDRLLSGSDANSEPGLSPVCFIDAIRHLIITLTSKALPLHERLSELLPKAQNLRILDWAGPFFPSPEDFNVLQALTQLNTFRVDAFAGETPWRLDHFACTLGPHLTSLELRMVDMEVYTSMVSQYNVFSSYHSLRHLSVDLTEGTWDWDGRGSPQMGASEKFVFKNFGFPALAEVEMQVSDLTIYDNRPGPMELVNWEPLKELTLKVVHCFLYTSLRRIRLFVALPPERFPSLTTLQIDDETWNVPEWRWNDEPPESEHEWDEKGRCYWGLVPSFLASVRSGLLQNLANLWVDRRVLCMPTAPFLQNTHPAPENVTFYSVKALWNNDPEHDTDETKMQKREWVLNLRAIFERMESLRVGLGEMDDVEVGLILDCCSPSKLSQFGFHWNWQAYGREDPISPQLLEHFSRFPKLADIHLLMPRPGTQETFNSTDRAVNSLVVNDIALIFKSNPSLCRVGIGRNTVWERHYLPTNTETNMMENVMLVHDGRVDERLSRPESIPKFYDAGAMNDPFTDDGYRSRPSHSAEIEELRQLLERVLESDHNPL